MADQPTEHEHSKDDADWVELLLGREAPGAPPGTVAEARAVRKAVIAREAAAQDASTAGLDALLFRLKREGLLGAARSGGGPRPLYMAMAAALVAAIALPMAWQMHSTPEYDAPYKTRSLTSALRLEARDPQSTAAELAKALQAAGVPVASTTAEGRVTLRGNVPPERMADIDAVLKRFGINGNARAELRIEVLQSGAAP